MWNGMRSQFIIMQQQQPAQNPFIAALLLRFEQDESQATREVLQRVCSSPDHRLDYLHTFNLLLNSRSSHSRQRRDVAAIARLIADSSIFATLQPCIEEEATRGESCGQQSLTIETTKLIANICNQNPHFVDNILTARPSILTTLCTLYSKAESTPTDGQSLVAVLNFLHNISLKETSLRNERVAPCLQAFLQNLLTHSKFCTFIAHKRFQSFVGSLFKFHANVPLVALGVYSALIKAVRALNQEYKGLAAIYDSFSHNAISSAERANLAELAGFADRKLIAIMKMFQKARTHIFSRFDALSFTPLLRVFVKIAIMRPVALLNQPIQNKLLVTIISDLMMIIQEFKKQLIANKVLPQHQNQPQPQTQQSRQSQSSEFQQGEWGEEQGEVLPPVQQDDDIPSLTPQQINRVQLQLKSFEEISEVTRHFSDVYFKIIKSTIETLAASFKWQEEYRNSTDNSPEMAEALLSYAFLNNIQTVRLQRILCMMLKLFSPEELKQGDYYSQIVGMLLKLLPWYFQAAISAENKVILEELPTMQDVSTESQGSAMRFIMETIDQQSVKTFIQGKLLQKINIFSTIYEAILKFVYHLVDDPKFLRENMLNFIHIFIRQLRSKHLDHINEADRLNLRQVQTLRFAMRVVTELFHGSVSPLPAEEMKNRTKLYRYCRLLVEQGGADGLFRLMGDILNNLQKHQIDKTSQLSDTIANRQQVVKTVFAKVMIQRAKSYVNYLTLAHISRTYPMPFQESSQQLAYMKDIHEGYYAYLKIMNDFIFQICPADRFVLFKEEIVAAAASRTLHYSVFVREEVVEEIAQEEGKILEETKKRVDAACWDLGEWMLANSHLRLHRVLMLTKKVLHFQKIGLAFRLGEGAMLHQEQLLHVQSFIKKVSIMLNRISLTLLNKKMDLQIRLPRSNPIPEEVQLPQEVQRITNLILMLSETMKLLVSEQYLEDAKLQIAPNYLYSVLGLITNLLQLYHAEEHFPTQANDLIHASLWLIETYLMYDNVIKKVRREMAERKKIVKVIKRKIQMKGRFDRKRVKRLRTEQDEEKEEQQDNVAEDVERQEKEGIQEEQMKKDYTEEFPNPTLNPKRRRRRKKNKKGKKKSKKLQKEQPKTLARNGSKTNLLQQSQAKTDPKHKPSSRSKASKSTLQRCIKEYLIFLSTFLGNCQTPIIKNSTLGYLLTFISQHMRRSIVQAPPQAQPQITLSELTPHLLRVKTVDAKVPGFYLALCKLGLQLFDDSHIKVDYELAIKRYIFQHAEGEELTLAQFLNMLRQNFKEVTASTANFVEISVVEEGRTFKMPFIKANYEELLSDKSKKCFIHLREGQELHLLTTRPEPSSRRKSSAPNEEHRPLKVSDYVPQGQLFAFIQHLITHSIRLLLSQIGRYIGNDLKEPQTYQTSMQPFTIRAVLQVLQYMVRESPSLGPFIARFKCRKIIQVEMANQSLQNREMVSSFALKSLTGGEQETMPQVGYLSVLIRLFSPLVVNAISGLVFQLCLDSTPLVQVVEGGKEGRAKGTHIAFGSVIRLKIVEELQNIMFQGEQIQGLFRKLCLLNLITVLSNIREMARLFLDSGFIGKLYKQFQGVKIAFAGQNSPNPLPGNFITKIITPFYLTPISILQELNIAFHYQKKLNKIPPKLIINTFLNYESINAQLVPADALKRYKFKLDWPFHSNREGPGPGSARFSHEDEMRHHPQQEDEDEYYAQAEGSFDSQAVSEQDQDSMDSENSSFVHYQDLEMPLDDDDIESYLSMQPHEQLLNQEWDYSDEHPEGDSNNYPSSDDPVIEIAGDGDEGEENNDLQAQDEDDQRMEHGEQDEEGDGEDMDMQDIDNADDDDEIQAYLQEQGLSRSQPSLINELNDLPSSVSVSSIFNTSLQPNRQFALNTINQQDYYVSVQALLNFDKVQSIPRISKAQKRQVYLLRFFLQLAVIHSREVFNSLHPRLKTRHEQKQQQQAQTNQTLILAFNKDRFLRLAQAVEYNQIYRYDHFHKERPPLTEELKKYFSDQLDTVRRHIAAGRRNGFIGREGLMEIMPGWTINQVMHQSNQASSEEEDSPLQRQPREEDQQEGSMLEINSQESVEDDSQGIGMDMGAGMQIEVNLTHEQQIARIQQILRAANLAWTPQQFLRLDEQTRNDILFNIAQNQQNHHDQSNSQLQDNDPRNSPVSFVEPADQNAVEVPMLELNSDRQPVDRLGEGRVMAIEALEDERREGEQEGPEGPQPQLQQMQGEQGQMQEMNQGSGHAVDEVYRKMSLQHSKKVSKDVMQALNKDGKNNNKFHQISFSQLEHLVQIFYLTTDEEHSKYPYPLIETLCINTVGLKRIASVLIVLLHMTPKPNEQAEDRKAVYSSVALKILHLLSHLTKSYSIAMALLRPNNDLSPKYAEIALPEQASHSSFQMLILLLKQKIVAQQPKILGFLITVLDNITMHHFYKNVHKIVENAGEEDERVRISQDSVYLLGELLQSDYVSDNLPLVSKIIMRLSVQEQNLKNFIGYLELLVRQLTDQALSEVKNTQQQEQEGNKETQIQLQPPLKIVNLMSIFFQMVKAFQTYPTTLDRHDEVMLSLRRIVEYQKLQQLCELAMRRVFEGDGKSYTRTGEVIDCFFVLYQIANITNKSGNNNNNPLNNTNSRQQEENEHNHIAELGELDLAQQQRRMAGEEEELKLGEFNLSKLWREAVAHPTFRQYVNSNIHRKIAEGSGQGGNSRRGSAFEQPIIKIASSTPHLLSFDNKYALFKNQLKRLRGRSKYEPIHISLRREDVFQASFQNLMTRSGQKLRGKLKIQFQGEQGEDAGGVTREWFQLLSREMFNPNYGLFRSGSAGHTYHPSPTSYFNDRHLDYFKFIGRITGKALYDGYLLDAYFTPAFYKHILALPITYRDMQQQDYEYFKSLTWILENSPIEEYLELTFTYDCDTFGQIQTKELIPGGSAVIVTEENKLQYVQLIAYARMATSIKLQLEAFLTGLHELVPHRLLKIFSEKELEIMISGRPTIDIEDLRRNTELVNYMRNDPIIVWLFQVLQAFDMELRTAFIQFVTGSSRVPVEGFKDLRGMNGVQRFNIHREFQEERLPRAHTCFNQLDLPNYKSKEILIQKLMYAITEGKEGFGMI